MNKRTRIRKNQRGVSLVEILVVLMIAAMVAGVVVTSMPPLRSAAQDESERFAARLSMAAEQAVTKGEMIGLKVEEDGYSFYRYDRGEWEAYNGDFKSAGSFSPDLAVEVTLADTAMKNQQSETKKDTEETPRPGVLFAPTGETTPFEIAFREKRARVDVVLDGAGGVKLVRHDEAR